MRISSSRYLLVQSEQRKHQNNMWNLFIVTNVNLVNVSLVFLVSLSLTLTDFMHCLIVSTVDCWLFSTVDLSAEFLCSRLKVSLVQINLRIFDSEDITWSKLWGIQKVQSIVLENGLSETWTVLNKDRKYIPLSKISLRKWA